MLFRHSPVRRPATPAIRIATLAFIANAVAVGAESGGDLRLLSLEELSNTEVTSVSKAGESLKHAAASIYVITSEEIARSGASSIPEVLRLAPNLEIRQVNAGTYTAAARGFAGNPVAQNFSNKLLVLIDGRSVYSPLFSGVYFDAQDVMLGDIDRIEVISGPGATLWGANAMNGVINIITKDAAETVGGFLDTRAGNLERHMGIRFGADRGDLDYRVYAKAFKRDPMEFGNGTSANDGWKKAQTGFRLDYVTGSNTWTTQGDLYKAIENEAGTLDLDVNGANLLTRWQRSTEYSDLSVQGYFDHTQRAEPTGGAAFVVHTYDLEIQQTMSVATQHRLIVGGGERVNRYHIANGESLFFIPTEQTLNIGNVFVHDTMSITERLELAAGIKLEQEPFSGWALLPDVKVSYQFSDAAMLWGSGARAIRTPTPFDHDVVEKAGGVDFLVGDRNFKSERVDAFEIGYRGQPFSLLSLSASIFYNRYDNLRSIETASPTVFLPLRWGNLMRGSTQGVELWAKWQVTDGWRLSPGVRLLKKHLEFKPGSSQLLGLAQAGDDPTSQLSLNSSMDFTRDVTLDLFLRHVGALPSPELEAYTELNARLGWRITPSLDLSLVGSNLLHARHRESPILTDPEIRRGFFAEARWSF